ncbi:MAG: ABC transporter substrate-binding protein [Deltaproteobacteria bacterium]|jgi:iron complex transport system substrate-binding protein|nr:ABC transporter substrate-binding protein [Deltaproteobacteria bacterium]
MTPRTPPAAPAGSLIAAAVLLAAASAASYARASAEVRGLDLFPATVTDAFGREVTVPLPPKRIVTVFSSNTELVASLGLSGLIVGIDAMTFYPPEIVDVRKIGGRLGISLEEVVDARPDLVLLTPARQAAHNLLGPLGRLGIPAAVFTARDFPEIEGNLMKTAVLCGVPGRGEELVRSLEGRLAAVRRARGGLPRPRTVILYARLSSGLFLAAREGDYPASLIGLAGGIPALDEEVSGPRVPQISPEALMGLDPDIIILTRRADEGTELFDYLQKPAFARLKARRTGQIHVVPSAEFLIPAARVVDGVERLARIFTEWGGR